MSSLPLTPLVPGTLTAGTVTPGTVTFAAAAAAIALHGSLPADVTASAPTGIVSVDQPMLVEAIADTPQGGVLALRGSDTTPYTLDAPLVINKAIAVRGSSLAALYGGSVATSSVNVPFASPYLSGSVLMQTTAATDVLQIPVAGLKVDLSNIGLTFDSAIRWANTGNGISAIPPMIASSDASRQNGLMSAFWQNLWCYGHDGNHYAWQLRNFLYCTFNVLRSVGGGGALLQGNSAVNYGDTMFGDFKADVVAAGTAHGIELVSPSSILNYIAFLRPEIKVVNESGLTALGVTPATSAQKYVTDSGAAKSTYISFIGGAFATNVGSALGTIPATASTYWSFVETLVPARASSVLGDVEIANTTLRSRAPSATLTAGAALGTSPPGFNNRTNLFPRGFTGNIRFGTGTSPTTGALIRINTQRLSSNDFPIPTVDAGNAATQALGLYVQMASDGSYWEICCVNAPAASQGNTTYEVYWQTAVQASP